MILGICDRFKVLPSQVLAEDVYLIKLLNIERLGKGDETGEEVTEEDYG